MGNFVSCTPSGPPPEWATNIAELQQLRERKNPNLDNLYERPSTPGITTISYYYHRPQKQWYWSPYSVGVYSVQSWIPVQNDRVPSGYGLYSNQRPATCNLRIIHYLAEFNPDPTNGILRVSAAPPGPGCTNRFQCGNGSAEQSIGDERGEITKLLDLGEISAEAYKVVGSKLVEGMTY